MGKRMMMIMMTCSSSRIVHPVASKISVFQVCFYSWLLLQKVLLKFVMWITFISCLMKGERIHPRTLWLQWSNWVYLLRVECYWHLDWWDNTIRSICSNLKCIFPFLLFSILDSVVNQINPFWKIPNSSSSLYSRILFSIIVYRKYWRRTRRRVSKCYIRNMILIKQ